MENKTSTYFQHLYIFWANRQAMAVGSAFILLGLLFGTWATFIPYVKDKFQLNDAELGLLLLCFPIGATIFNPISAWVIKKLGMRTATVIGMINVSIMYLLPLYMPTITLTGTGLVLMGMSIAQLNVAMNTCTAVIEQTDKINIMSTSHGLFSLGLMLGSLIASISYGAGVLPPYHMLIMSVIGCALTWIARNDIYKVKDAINTDKVPYAENDGKSPKEEVRKALLIMVLISICSNITEGSMADWTAVYMRDVVQCSPYMIGWGLSGYSMFMALGRFMGDGLMPIYGGRKLLLYGSLIVVGGLLVSILFPVTVLSIIGFSLVGYGISFTSPIIYGSSARIPGYSEGKGLAILNSFGMIGFLGGPVFIGFLSRAFDLRIAFCFLAFLAILWGTFTRKVKLY